MSVLEVARVTIDPTRSQQFEEVFREAITLVQAASGHRGSRLVRDVENPGTYLFLVRWDDLADHVDRFAESEAFGRFESLIGPFLRAAPEVTHVESDDVEEVVR